MTLNSNGLIDQNANLDGSKSWKMPMYGDWYLYTEHICNGSSYHLEDDVSYQHLE